MSLELEKMKSQSGMTLAELAVLVILLIAFGFYVIPLATQYADTQRNASAQSSLEKYRAAIAGAPGKPGILEDTGELPSTVYDLFVNPYPPTHHLFTFNAATGRGWRGPYLICDGTTGIDPWGNQIVIQRPPFGPENERDAYVRLISPGPNGVIDTPQNCLYPVEQVRGDDIVLFINRDDSASAPASQSGNQP